MTSLLGACAGIVGIWAVWFTSASSLSGRSCLLMLTPAVSDGGFLHRAVMVDREEGMGWRIGRTWDDDRTGNREADADGTGLDPSGGLDPALPMAAARTTTAASSSGPSSCARSSCSSRALS